MESAFLGGKQKEHIKRMHNSNHYGAVMVAYYSFYIYILMMSGSLFVGMLSVRRKNVERALTMLIVVLLALIGLSSNLNEWYRVYAGIRHIVVNSWG